MQSNSKHIEYISLFPGSPLKQERGLKKAPGYTGLNQVHVMGRIGKENRSDRSKAFGRVEVRKGKREKKRGERK